jgi:hypothetical protein
MCGASVVLGVGSSVFRYLETSENKNKHDEHTKNLGKRLIKDVKFYQQFLADLKEVEEESFQFELLLENSIRKFSGNGRTALKKNTERILPTLHNIQIKDKAGKEVLHKTLKAAEDEEAKKKEKLEIQLEVPNVIGKLTGTVGAKILKEVGDELITGVVSQTAELAGGLSVGLGKVDAT